MFGPVGGFILVDHFPQASRQSLIGGCRFPSTRQTTFATQAAILAASTALSVTLIASSANAQQIIDGPTVGPIPLNGNQSLLVTDSGSIFSPGDGVVLNGDGNIVTSFGSVAVDGIGFFIQSGTGNSITNSGVIAGIGTGFSVFGDQSAVTNFGAISTTGSGAFGFGVFGDSSTINNAGSISTTGVTAHGMNIGGNQNTINNSGDISTAANTSSGFNIFGDENIVTSSGDVLTQGTGAAGVDISGDNNTFTNSGRVTTTASDGFLIDGGTGNTITNFGSVVAGIAGFDVNSTGNSITNFGSIFAIGDGIDIGAENNTVVNYGDIFASETGIELNLGSGNGVVINYGNITTSDTVARGIAVRSDQNTITNYGRISTQGNEAQGVQFAGTGANNVFINYGAITTQGSSSDGIEVGAPNNTVFNFGSIQTQGANARGIEIRNTDNLFTNSGSVVSANAEAILLAGTANNNTLNLLAPGFLGGSIDFTAVTNTTISIGTGPSQSILWTLDGVMVGGAPNLSGTVPTFYNVATQTVATFDPTVLSTETAALGDLTSLLSHVGLGAIDGFSLELGPSSSFNPLGFFPMAEDTSPNSERFGRGWLTVLGGHMDHEGNESTLDSTVTHVGVAAGYTWQQDDGLLLNAMAGYLAGTTEADATWSPSFDHDAQTLFAGLHGKRSFGSGLFEETAVRFGITAGYTNTDHSRFVNDNLAPLGQSWVAADFGGIFLSPEVALSNDIAMANGTILTPNAGVRYAAQWFDGYSETGAFSAAANATVEERFVSTLETNIGLNVTRSFVLGDHKATLTGSLGYLGRWSTGQDDVGVTLNGITQDVASEASDLNAAIVGATFRSEIGETGFVELSGTYLHGDSAQGVNGLLTVGLTF